MSDIEDRKYKMSAEVASMVLKSFQSQREIELGKDDIIVRAIDTALECIRKCTLDYYKQKGLDKYIDLEKYMD